MGRLIVIIGITFTVLLILIIASNYYSPGKEKLVNEDINLEGGDNALLADGFTDIKDIGHKSDGGVNNSQPTIPSEEPTNLALPYDTNNLDLVNGGGHPFGIYRFSQDKQPHPGIDLILKTGTSIHAMTSGKVVYISEDNRFPGGYSTVRLQVGDSNWAIEYESLVLNDGISIGDLVDEGDMIGVFNGGYELNPAMIHIDLRNYDDTDFIKPMKAVCWINNLDSGDKEKIISAWDEVKFTDEFQSDWNDQKSEGNYFLRGLLDKERFPDGPKICYEGVDVRESV